MTGLLFGVKKDDFDFMIDADEKGTPIIYECYPNALKLKYENQSCSIYEVEEKGFLKNQTNWEPELVSKVPVKVQQEVRITDIYSELQKAIREGNLIFYEYKEERDFKAVISEHVVDRIIRFDMLEHVEEDERFSLYYGKIVEQLKKLISGKYL